jgi:hypothetical protein
MINERGSFTNPRAETVTIRALGQRISHDESAAIDKVRFCSALDDLHVASLHRHEGAHAPE